MSALSYMPNGEILDYWYEKLLGHPQRMKFVITKAIEIRAFKSQSLKKEIPKYEKKAFPIPLDNKIPDNPTNGIVIPAYIKNERDKKCIENLFHSIQEQEQKPDCVIVVDDCSPMKYYCPDFVIVKRLDKNMGPASARNIGKKIANQKNIDVILFTDSDCVLSKDWVKTVNSVFIKEKHFNILSGNTLSWNNHWLGTYHNINGTLNGRILKNTERLLYGTTANLAISANVSKNINFNCKFPLAAGEDIEFCFRANQSGFAIKHIEEMVVYHDFGYSTSFLDSIGLFIEMFKKYGKGENVLLEEIPEYYHYFNETLEIPAIK